MLIAPALALLIWIVILLLPSRPWDFQPVGEDAEEPPVSDGEFPPVAVLVPARNEADTLPATLPKLLTQAYPGPLRVVLIDDRSDDGTAEVAKKLREQIVGGAADPKDVADLTVLEGEELPAGWVGKMWALEQGGRYAFAPEREAEEGHHRARFVMLTDADILHEPDSLRRLVAESLKEGFGLNSRMARLRAKTFWERLLIPAFVFFFNLLYPMRKVNDPEDPMAAAAGGCVLLKREAYDAIGGLGCIKNELIDDVNLGRQVKGHKFPIRLALSRTDVASERGYDTLGGIWRMVRRTAFTELHYSWLRLVGCVIVMAIMYLSPVAGAVISAMVFASGAGTGAAVPLFGSLLGVSLASLLLMTLIYWPAVRFYRVNPLYVLSLPLVAVLYLGMTIDSAMRHATGVRSSWRGRSYDSGTEGA
ncbi:MAG: glycosyltransferase [Planctomycetota bacterium]|jgi:hopene-associated glycosyltransferase HpnB